MNSGKQAGDNLVYLCVNGSFGHIGVENIHLQCTKKIWGGEGGHIHVFFTIRDMNLH